MCIRDSALIVLAEFATRTVPLAAAVKPVPPFPIGNVPVTFAVKSILPANIAFVTPLAFTRNASELISIELPSTPTDKVLPDLANPSPAVI